MFEKIKKLLCEEMSLNEADITPETELVNDLGLNSLEMADMIVICEEKFDITFEDDDLASLVTIGDVVNYIESHTEE